MLNPTTKRLVIDDIKRGVPTATIAYNRGVDAELVATIVSAVRVVDGLRRSGSPPALIYANFKDLVTLRECGAPPNDSEAA